MPTSSTMVSLCASSDLEYLLRRIISRPLISFALGSCTVLNADRGFRFPGQVAGQFEGKVVCVARQCDLALVQVVDNRFWEGLPQV